jgi:response regulator NasT
MLSSAAAPLPAALTPAAMPDEAAPANAGVRVLIAEDDLPARALLVEALTALGHTVVAEVASGRDAVEEAARLLPDVVLLDVHMPDSSGLEGARGIAAQLPGTAVLLYTGDQTLSLSAQDIAETSAVSILAKPTPPNTLDAALRLAVARARATAEATREASAAREALEARKTIERAKGILMRRTGVGEQEAYRILQRTSQDRATSMVEIAKAVLASEPGINANAKPGGRSAPRR